MPKSLCSSSRSSQKCSLWKCHTKSKLASNCWCFVIVWQTKMVDTKWKGSSSCCTTKSTSSRFPTIVKSSSPSTHATIRRVCANSRRTTTTTSSSVFRLSVRASCKSLYGQLFQSAHHFSEVIFLSTYLFYFCFNLNTGYKHKRGDCVQVSAHISGAQARHRLHCARSVVLSFGDGVRRGHTHPHIRGERQERCEATNRATPRHGHRYALLVRTRFALFFIFDLWTKDLIKFRVFFFLTFFNQH